MSFLTKIFGSRNQRLLKQYQKTVREISALEPQLEALSDEQLQAKTPEFKERIAKGEELDALLPEAFAVCREASKRVLKMRHFDVQMIGGMVLHYGKIAEMGTGEGKTLMATLPTYLNALAGKGVHVVTVNDYLAQRDAEWMGKLYGWLGLSTGVNLSQLDHDAKQLAYGSDITYGTNNEFGFDYLRDNMVYEARDRVQRVLNFAVVDEVDSILIDEARTPLIISGQAENHTDLYYKINEVPKLLTLQIGEETPDGKGQIEVPGDYTKDEKSHQVLLTEAGHDNAERILTQMGLLPEGASLYDAANITLIHHLYAALRAHALYFKDQHYVVQNNEVVIVDEFTGRLMTGRRWSDGLQELVGVLRHPLQMHFKVQVGAGRTPGRADIGDMLAALDDVAHLHINPGGVRVTGHDVAAVVNFQHIAKLRMVFRGNHHASRGGDYRRTGRRRKIYSFMKSAAAGKRIEPPTETGSAVSDIHRLYGRQ